MTPNYILLDAARLFVRIHEATAINPEHRSLYEGRSEEPLADLGPFLFTVPNDETFVNWYSSNGWGNAWGVLIETEASFDELFEHFRNFLLVKTDEDKELYFRFYDPRVLKTFLPTCRKDQLIQFFGPVDKFITEDNTKETAIEFSIKNRQLYQRKLNTSLLSGTQPILSAELSATTSGNGFVIIDDEMNK